MSGSIRFSLSLFFVIAGAIAAPYSCIAQGITVQQPVVSVFSVNTVVGVPDGGTMSLGGISGGAYGRTSRGIPMLGNIPYLNRGFRNQSIGQNQFASNASVNVKVIVLEELDAMVTAEGERRAALRTGTDPNGTVQTQRKADFISRNIGGKRIR